LWILDPFRKEFIAIGRFRVLAYNAESS